MNTAIAKSQKPRFSGHFRKSRLLMSFAELRF
jgi:hypothetical protein